MGELHVNMNVTLDGVIQANGGPNEQDAGFEYAGWERPYWDEEAGAQMDQDVQEADVMLLGRTTYDLFRGYWPGKQDEIGRNFDRVPKYVASRGTPELSWDSSTQITDAGAEVRDLRERHELIHTWGSGNLLQDPVPRGPGRPAEPVGVPGGDRYRQEALFGRHHCHAVRAGRATEVVSSRSDAAALPAPRRRPGPA